MQTETYFGAKIYHSNFDDVVISAIQAGVVPHIWGPPGVGKSARVYALADLIDHEVFELRAALRDAIDLRGSIEVIDGLTHNAPPAELPQEGCPPTLMFVDELQQAHKSVTAPLGQLIYERRLGDYRLPDNVVIVAASNRTCDRAGANQMLSHTASRMVHFELVPDANHWLEWARENDIDERITDFINYRNDYVYKFDPKAKEPAFACLRSWEMLSKMIKGQYDNDVIRTLAEGTVGREASAEFMVYVECLAMLPSLDAIIADPDSVEVPQEMDIQFAVQAALSRRSDEANIDNVWKFVSRLRDEFSSIWFSDTNARKTASNPFNLSDCPVYPAIVNAHKNNLAGANF